MSDLKLNFKIHGFRDRTEKHTSPIIGGEDKMVLVGTELLLDTVFNDERDQHGNVNPAEHADVIKKIQDHVKANPGATFALTLMDTEEKDTTFVGEPDSEEPATTEDDHNKA